MVIRRLAWIPAAAAGLVAPLLLSEATASDQTCLRDSYTFDLEYVSYGGQHMDWPEAIEVDLPWRGGPGLPAGADAIFVWPAGDTLSVYVLILHELP